jgi:hypothetical protein
VSEAELRIKPVLAGVGSWRRGISGLKGDTRALGRTQVSELARGRREAARLEGSFDRVGRSARSIGDGLKSSLGQLASLKTLAAGFVVGGAGKTIVDGLIGSNAKLEAQKITFNTLVGDADKAAALLARVRRYAAETPFQQDDLIEGSKALLRLTGENADENMRLLEIAGKFAAINPTKSVGDAVEALLDAEGLEFERLKEFGIKLKKEDIQKYKESGKTLGDAALKAVEAALTKQTGGRDPVTALSKSFNGKLSTFKDQFKEFVRKGGEPAFEVLKDGMDEVGEAFGELGADPAFKKDMEELAGYSVEIAKASVRLAKEFPGFVRDLRKFGEEYGDVIKVVGGGLLVNKLTGGAAGRLAVQGGGALLGGTMRLGSRVLFGKKGGRMGRGGGALGQGIGAAGAMPVYVVNMGEMGGMAGDLLGEAAELGLKTLVGAGSAKGAGVAMGSYGISGSGLVGVAGAGLAAGVGAGLATTAAVGYGGWQVAQATDKFNKHFEARAKAAQDETDWYNGMRNSMAFKEFTRTVDQQKQDFRRDEIRSAETSLLFKGGRGGGAAGARYRLENAFQMIDPSNVFEQRAFVAQTNNRLRSQGIEVDFDEDGTLLASALEGAGASGRRAARELAEAGSLRPQDYQEFQRMPTAEEIGQNVKRAMDGVLSTLGVTVVVQGNVDAGGVGAIEEGVGRALERNRSRS